MDREQYLKIARPRNVCVACDAPLQGAGKHPSALVEPGDAPPAPAGAPPAADDGAPVRLDYCPACWAARGTAPVPADGPPAPAAPEFVAHWMARREAPKPRKSAGKKERAATLLSYLDLLGRQADPARAGHAFVAAHLLMKQGALKWMRSEAPASPGQPERIVFRNGATDELVTIDGTAPADDRVAEIHAEIEALLAGAPAP